LICRANGESARAVKPALVDPATFDPVMVVKDVVVGSNVVTSVTVVDAFAGRYAESPEYVAVTATVPAVPNVVVHFATWVELGGTAAHNTFDP
jgi:hypothetical protein